VFVGDVVLNASGEPAGLVNIALVAANGVASSWGGDQRIAFLRWNGNDTEGFVVDVTNPNTPLEFSVGAVEYGPPELSSTGQFAVYSRSVGGRLDLFVLDTATLIETRITDASRVPESEPAFPTWSPDDQQILFSVNDSCSDRCRSLAVIDVVGTARRNTITKTFVVQDGKGKNSRNAIVGAAGSAIWRD
jgi:Tol biopolymer transport system component